MTQTPEVTKVLLHADESVVIFLLSLFSVGIAIGSLLCKTLTKNQVSFRLLPYGLLGLSVFAMALYFLLNQLSLALPIWPYAVMDIIHQLHAWPVFIALFYWDLVAACILYHYILPCKHMHPLITVHALLGRIIF